MRLRKAARVILIGAPGVGKGTQSERLLSRFPDLKSISTGDLLRHHVKTRTPLGIKVEGIVKSGGLVADDLMLRLISNELFTRGWVRSQDRSQVMTLAASSLADSAADVDVDSYVDDPVPMHARITAPSVFDGHVPPQASDHPSASYILDGFPRTAAQANLLDRIVPINLAVSISTPLEIIMGRVAGRWVHEPSGRVYNTSFNAPAVPGRDDVTGEPLVQRADDSAEIYRARWEKFQETSRPLLEHYAKKGVLWEVEGLCSDEISPMLYAEFERRFTAA